MNIIVVVTESILILLFIALGILFSSGKGDFLIAGFNTMPKTEKDKFDKTALCKFIGKVMFALGFCTIFWVLSEIIGANWLLSAGIILYFAVIVFTLIYANTFNRFKIK